MTQNMRLLDGVLEEIVTRWGVPGLGVGIVNQGEIVYTRGFGVQSLDTGTPVTPDSLFCVASIGKVFAASAILQLAEQRKLDLDAPVVQYLPYFRLADERYGQITLRQVLSHTSGIPDMDELEYDDLVSHPEYDAGAAERYVRGLADRRMIGAPGERFAYSNIGYNVLGDLIAKVSGQTFESYLQEHILGPAGMPDSTFYYPDVPTERLAVPHLRAPQLVVNPIYPYHRADAPASFLHTSVVEMCHWIITNLNRGQYQERRILTPAAYDLMWQPVIQRGVPPFREAMGLGWTLGSFEGAATVGHGGGGFGWTCFLVLLPEKNCGAIILSNEESAAHERALEAVLHTMLGKQPQAGRVSWMVPITRALASGGIQAAYTCYDDIKGSTAYEFDAYDLISLSYQLLSAKKADLAVEVLALNAHAFPEDLGAQVFLAENLIRAGELARAEAAVQKALAISPDNKTARRLLAEIEAGK